ncbi:MAG: DUF3800 domain-containing protein [Planctomycetota bacterium]|nr:DUF3800 domain-containing protein [Planctomycetota bacterium]
MSWLLFLDESGHDHKNMPYEVRGGIALHAGRLWPFIQGMQRLELDSFGCQLHQFRHELKGSTSVDRKRYKFARQSSAMEPDARRKHCRGFLTKGLESKPPTRDEFTAYGQACLEMAGGVFQLLSQHGAVLFAAAIPRGSRQAGAVPAEYLRKDQVFLLERYFYFLELQRDYGLLVVDEVEKVADRKFVRQLEAYFTKTVVGRERTVWIVPSPFFVASDMAYPIQAADLCIYCVNLGFRLPNQGMDQPVRQEIADDFGPWIHRLQFRGEGHRDGQVFETFGICYVPNPYGPGRA